MNVQWTERIFAASIPVCLAAFNLMLPLLAIAVPVIFYFTSKKLRFGFAANHALRIFDTVVSVMIVGFTIGLLFTGLSIAARDGGFTLAIFESGLAHSVLYIVLTAYSVLALFLHLIFALLGREFKMPFALRPFEALRGRKVSAKQTPSAP